MCSSGYLVPVYFCTVSRFSRIKYYCVCYLPACCCVDGDGDDVFVAVGGTEFELLAAAFAAAPGPAKRASVGISSSALPWIWPKL